MENWLGMRSQIEQGNLVFPLSPDTRLQMIAVDDIGALAAMAFPNGPAIGKVEPSSWRATNSP